MIPGCLWPGLGPDLLFTEHESAPESKEDARKIRPEIWNPSCACQAPEQGKSHEKIGRGDRIKEQSLPDQPSPGFSRSEDEEIVQREVNQHSCLTA